MYTTCFNHYPAVLAKEIRTETAARQAAHSDFGTLTLLFQHDVGGLEVADMSSTEETASRLVEETANFIPVDPQPGLILVLVGHMLMRWTNARYKNTVHRVSEPPIPAGESEEILPNRYSIAFFGFPDSKTVVKPFASCCTQRKSKYLTINAGKWKEGKRKVINVPSRMAPQTK